MSERRVGLWLIGAFGGVGGTTALGLASLAKRLTEPVGMATALPRFAHVDFDPAESFTIGGHDIRNSSFPRAVAELHSRANVFSEKMIESCTPTLAEWTRNVRPGVLTRTTPTIEALADRTDLNRQHTSRSAIERIQADIRGFRNEHRLEQVVVVNVASTEPPFPNLDQFATRRDLDHALDDPHFSPPTSLLYATAAIDAGFPYINCTPSTGSSVAALEDLAIVRGVPHVGRDLKTGETLLKSVLAPMFAQRNLKVLSWVGHNILGNRDGQVLNDPHSKASKLKSKDGLLAELLGYRPQSHVSIEYVESLDDWKTAWDHIHFAGFLDVKMTLQFTWQGCDSVLAAPLVIDLARLMLRAQRLGERGIFTPAAVFFKEPPGVPEHDFSRQFMMLERYLIVDS